MPPTPSTAPTTASTSSTPTPTDAGGCRRPGPSLWPKATSVARRPGGDSTPLDRVPYPPRSVTDSSIDRLLQLLDLAPAGNDCFTGITPSEGPGRLFGGQVAAQSLRAATLTVDASRPPHSLHAYFIRPGRPGTPLDLSVERTRDGRSFTTRHVTAAQNGEPIFMLSASFHGGEEGDDWQL